MKVLLLTTFVVILGIAGADKFDYSVVRFANNILYGLPIGAVKDVDPYCNDAPELHLPHPWDCTKFYRCVANKKIWLSCPSTLFFNRKLEVCDWPNASGCIPGTGPPTTTLPMDPPTTKPTPKPTTTTNTKPTTTTTTKPTTKPTITSPTTTTTRPTVPTITPKPTTKPPSGDCPAGIDMNFHPNPNDCRKYWQCIEGIKNDYTCPLGTYFNPVKINCDPNNGQCDK